MSDRRGGADVYGKGDEMRYAIKLCAGMIFLAGLLLAAAYFLKGSPAGEWVKSGIYLLMMMWYAYEILAMPRCGKVSDRKC